MSDESVAELGTDGEPLNAGANTAIVPNGVSGELPRVTAVGNHSTPGGGSVEGVGFMSEKAHVQDIKGVYVLHFPKNRSFGKKNLK
jgi:hypothetical protein